MVVADAGCRMQVLVLDAGSRYACEIQVISNALQGYQSQLKNSIKLLRTNYGLFIKKQIIIIYCIC